MGGALVGGLGGGIFGAFGGALGAGMSSKLAPQTKAAGDAVANETGSILAGNILSGLAGAAVGGTAGAAMGSNVNLYNQGHDKNETEAQKEAQDVRARLDHERAMLGQVGANTSADGQAVTVRGGALVAGAAANAVYGVKLNKSLASQQQISQLSGNALSVAGNGSNVPLRDAPRLAAQYGGDASNWSKVTSSSYTASDGTQYEIHAYKNAVTGQVVEPKTVVTGK